LLQIYAEKEHPLKQKIAKHASKIEHSVRALNNLLTSVLFFGKADENKMEYKPKKVFMTTFVKELLDTVKAGIENDVKIKSEIGALPKTVTTDPDLLYQVLENLLSNAVKYSKEGKEVEFKLDIQDDRLVATISDHGIGIPKAEQGKLFDRFFRGGNVGIVEGTGLGLSIVKKCIEMLEGEVSFESEAGKGTTFHVSIPVS
jgi:signal transduction histidine kinase